MIERVMILNNTFIYPCSLNFYYIVSHLESHNKIVWRKTSYIKINDIVFICIGKPYYEIKYKCVVVNDDVDSALLDKNLYAIPKGKIAAKCSYARLALTCSYPQSTFTLDELKVRGMRQFMIPMHATPELSEYLNAMDDSLTICKRKNGDK